MAVASEPYGDRIKEIARKEGVDEDVLTRRFREGRVVIPCNPVHNPQACGIGEGLSVKVNVNLGTSRDRVEVEEEMEKLRISLEYGADAVMKERYGVSGSYKKVSEHARRHFGRYAGYAQEYLYLAEDRAQKKASTASSPGTRTPAP